MGWTTVKKIFADHEQLLQRKLEVRGWIRTQRESKNFAFIELNDGSCFKNLQVVYGDELANFDAVAKYPLGSSLKVTGTLVPSPAAGQPFELKAGADRGHRPVRPGLPAAEEAPLLRVPAHHPPPAAAHQHLHGRFPRAQPGGLRPAQVLP